MSEDRPGSGLPGTPAGGLSEEQVARLLSSAGGAEPTPPDVTTRLDAVLADLVAVRTEGTEGTEGIEGTEATEGTEGTEATVSSLSARRARRPWGRRLLVAAAVLGVAGIGVSVLDDLGGGGSADSASAGDAADSSLSQTEAGSGSDRGAREESGAGGSTADAPEASSDALRVNDVPRITDRASLRAAVRAGAGPDGAGRDGAERDVARNQERDGKLAYDTRAYLTADAAGCAVPRGPGARTLVRYEGSPATLVVRRVGDRLDGRVYDCDLGLQVDGVEIGPAEE